MLWLSRCVPTGVDSSPASSGLATLQSAWHAIEAMTDLYEQCTAARTLRLDTMVAVRGDIDKLEDAILQFEEDVSAAPVDVALPPLNPAEEVAGQPVLRRRLRRPRADGRRELRVQLPRRICRRLLPARPRLHRIKHHAGQQQRPVRAAGGR